MITLLLITVAVVVLLIYRTATALLGQIPDGNRDFNAFSTDGSVEQGTNGQSVFLPMRFFKESEHA